MRRVHANLATRDSGSAKAGFLPVIVAAVVVVLALLLIVVWLVTRGGDSVQERRHGDEKQDIEQQHRAELQSILAGKIRDKDEAIAVLQSAFTAAQSESQQLAKQVATLNASISGGLELGEREQALDAKERRLAALSEDLQGREAVLKTREDVLRKQEIEFYESTKISREDIGEARALAKQHDYLATELDSERRANKQMLSEVVASSNSLPMWMALFGLLILCAFAVVAFIYSRGRAAQMQQIKELRTLVVESTKSATRFAGITDGRN